MAFRKIRTLYVAVAILGIAIMLGHDVLVELGFEGSRLGASLTVVIVGAAVTFLYERRLHRQRDIDERVERIRRFAAERAFGVETAGIGVLILVLQFGAWDVPVVPVLLAIMLGSVVTFELANEYYRRRM